MDSSSISSIKADNWSCRTCTFSNSSFLLSCEMCGWRRPKNDETLPKKELNNTIDTKKDKCTTEIKQDNSNLITEEETIKAFESCLDNILICTEKNKFSKQQYLELYDVLCPLHQRSISLSTSLYAWEKLSEHLLSNISPLHQHWILFCTIKNEKRPDKTVSKDVWRCYIDFLQQVSPDLSNHDPLEAWPSMIDDFVDWLYEQQVPSNFTSISVSEKEKSSGMSPLDTCIGDGKSVEKRKERDDSPINEESSLKLDSTSKSSSIITPLDTSSSSIPQKLFEFRGLYNQGATCYMNSLLQSIYMTPEFRIALYNWKYKKDEEERKEGKEREEKGKVEEREGEEDSTPLQLQRLFARLQFLKTTRAISTRSLTKSFGWDSSDAFVQHDVQELCRVLFDELENSCETSCQENMVKHLFAGAMKDYVECMSCGYGSERTDVFLDISLDIHGVTCLSEAMEKYVTPEILRGQWRCPICNTTVDAKKGLKIEKWPYILMIQLKRFDYDYRTMRRYKLNHRVSFPHQIDLQKWVSADFIPEAQEQEDDAEEKKKAVDSNLPVTQLEKEINRTEKTLLKYKCLVRDDPHSPLVEMWSEEIRNKEEKIKELKETIKQKHQVKEEKSSGKKEKEHKKYSSKKKEEEEKKKEEEEAIDESSMHLYELYSVMIHSGSAGGGHYYAYIKSFEDNTWYNFNDSVVDSVSESVIENTFGGGSYGSSAYLVMYRRKDPEKNIRTVHDDIVPPHLRNIEPQKEDTSGRRSSYWEDGEEEAGGDGSDDGDDFWDFPEDESWNSDYEYEDNDDDFFNIDESIGINVLYKTTAVAAVVMKQKPQDIDSDNNDKEISSLYTTEDTTTVIGRDDKPIIMKATIKVLEEDTLLEVKRKAMEEFGLSPSSPSSSSSSSIMGVLLKDARLRHYKPSVDVARRPFDEAAELLSLESLRVDNDTDLLLETRISGEEFPPFDIYVSLYRIVEWKPPPMVQKNTITTITTTKEEEKENVREEKEKIPSSSSHLLGTYLPPIELYLPRTSTLLGLKTTLASKLPHISSDNVVIAHKGLFSISQLEKSFDDKRLVAIGVFEGTTLYVQDVSKGEEGIGLLDSLRKKFNIRDSSYSSNGSSTHEVGSYPRKKEVSLKFRKKKKRRQKEEI